MTKCNGTKLLPHNYISLTFWTIFSTENIRYPFNIFQVIKIWETKYLKANMKGYIPLVTAAIFFLANLFLKQGIG